MTVSAAGDRIFFDIKGGTRTEYDVTVEEVREDSTLELQLPPVTGTFPTPFSWTVGPNTTDSTKLFFVRATDQITGQVDTAIITQEKS